MINSVNKLIMTQISLLLHDIFQLVAASSWFNILKKKTKSKIIKTLYLSVTTSQPSKLNI